MGQIFISYSRRDTETVDRIVSSLDGAGLDVWLDRADIAAGNSWRVQIVEAIDTCDAFVLMLSGNSAMSTNVHKEVILAQDSGRRIFVVMLDPVKPPAEIRYQLAGLQFIDLQMLGLDKSTAQLINALKEYIKKIRPVAEQTQHQTELVIQGIDISAFTAEKQRELLAFISSLANTDPSQLKIANMTAGSVHVFMDMPAGSAFELKTLALNRDKRFKKLGITSLRLAGDKKFINISLGILTTAATIGFLQALWLSVPSMLVPIVGITVGKVLTITLIVGLTAGLALSVPNAIAPPLSPSPTPTPTWISTPISTPTSAPTPKPTLTSTLEPTLPPTQTSTLTFTPLPTFTPQNPLVLGDIVCWVGPGPRYEVVGGIRNGTPVELIGRANGWWIIVHPTLNTECWVREQELQVDLDTDISKLPIIPPPVFPTRTPRPTQPATACPPESEDPACYTPYPYPYPSTY